MNQAPEAQDLIFQPSSLIPHPSDVVDVAVAVILRPDGSFLLAQRPPGKPYANYWEFPGGKVKPGEAMASALRRELLEELGIGVDLAYPWITRVFTYPHATVRLCFHRVVSWRGEPQAHENQQLSWEYPNQVGVSPLLPANAPVLRALALPAVYAISNTAELGREVFLERLKAALDNGLRLIQVREKQMPSRELGNFAAEVLKLAQAYGAKVIINSDIALAEEIAADGVHLTAAQLMSLSARPDVELCGASCHDPAELARAAELNVDFVVLAPVMPTLSHPNSSPLGWQAFSDLIRSYSLPVYALGGLRPADLPNAWAHGAHGISMMRAAWPQL